jgi:hypothetical protein
VPRELKPKARSLLWLSLTALAAFATASCQRPSPDWNGTWKLDPFKSDIPGPTITVSITSDGMYHNASGGSTANFGCDGNGYQATETLTAFCTQKSSSELEIAVFKNGSKVSTAHWELSPDRRSLTIRSTSPQADGALKSKEKLYTRTSGSTGFAGGWRNVNPLEGIPSTRQIVLKGHALHESYPGGQYADVTLDGADAALHGPGVSAGVSIALRERSPRELSSTTKQKGQVVNVGYWRISAEGRSLTESYWSPDRPDEKAVLVYEKQ